MEPTDDRLRVRERPWQIGFIGGITFTLIFWLIFFSVGEIHCQRQTVPY
ncbi:MULTISPECIES: hypothetical protein [unclassified Thermosynechococcus]|nr:MULTISPECIES: hypothetical protein [unclassified Thermosynechococcus]HIK34915.1 hypothetical protein [Thermosynechococcus sp. M98_K2018_005]HIK47408.1 hypothetical protein [Thermosynechococcus sp. M55_K2018_012]